VDLVAESDKYSSSFLPSARILPHIRPIVPIPFLYGDDFHGSRGSDWVSRLYGMSPSSFTVSYSNPHSTDMDENGQKVEQGNGCGR
jgi:hypothetical protein